MKGRRLQETCSGMTRQGTTPPRAASSCEGCRGHPARWMVRTTQPSGSRRVVKASGAVLRELPRPLPASVGTNCPAHGAYRARIADQASVHRNVHNECALLDRTREWRSPQLACVIN